MVIQKSIQRAYRGNNRTQKHSYNEVKFKILRFLQPHKRHYAPEEIANELGLTPGSVRTRLSKLHQLGYIWRKKEYRTTRRNPFCYGALKPLGERVLNGTNRYTGMIQRREMQRITGESITLNLKREPTLEQKRKYERLRMRA